MTPATIAIGINDSSSLKWGLAYPSQQQVGLAAPVSIALRSMKTALPEWADDVVERLAALAILPTVDGRANRPMNLDDVVDALRFLARVMRDDLPTPWIGRLNSGGVQLTWRDVPSDVEVEAIFDRTRNEREVIVAVGENEWDAPVDEADSLFATVVDRLAHLNVEHASTA